MSKMFKLTSVVMLCMILALVTGCKDTPKDVSKATSSETPPTQVTYTVRVQNEYEEPMMDIKVFIYEDFSQGELVCVGTTDERGMVSFSSKASDSYVAVLSDIPVGHTSEQYYGLPEETTVITLPSRELTPEELENFNYSLGDRMKDFTVADCDGKEHQLSVLLEEYKAVVLNFWFINCGPCKMEFPYLQEAYEQYGDRAAFLALNPVDGSVDEINEFKAEHGLDFPMGACNISWQNLMGISAYPTTVIVDRNGHICLIHEGMFTDSTALCNAMDYFLADDYEQVFFESIEQIPVRSGSNDASEI